LLNIVQDFIGKKKTVTLPLGETNKASQDLNMKTKELRVAFSFDHERFITPYFTIVDGKGTLLEILEFTFIVSGDDLVDVNWKTHYNTDKDHEHDTQLPNTLTIQYKWEDFAEIDTVWGLNTLLFMGFSAGLLTFIYVIIDSEQRNVGIPMFVPNKKGSSLSINTKNEVLNAATTTKGSSIPTKRSTMSTSVTNKTEIEHITTNISTEPDAPTLQLEEIPEDELEDFVGSSSSLSETFLEKKDT